ncbi:MAG TPA: hypothetical protein VK324_17925 [Tepidisphaeraceae bacterium]|nr:hypothetical protein [Tepidisphaeraceae bacterium]
MSTALKWGIGGLAAFVALLIALTVASLFGREVPPGSRYGIAMMAALFASFAFAMFGGAAEMKGSVPILEAASFRIGGVVAVFLLTLVVTNYALHATGLPAAPPLDHQGSSHGPGQTNKGNVGQVTPGALMGDKQHPGQFPPNKQNPSQFPLDPENPAPQSFGPSRLHPDTPPPPGRPDPDARPPMEQPPVPQPTRDGLPPPLPWHGAGT